MERSSARWMTMIKDMDNTLKWFLKSCKEAGPQSCAFYEDSVEAMESKLNGIYSSLIRAPIPVENDVSYGLVDYGTVRYTILRFLYSPFAMWRDLATGLAGLAEGNATAFYDLVAAPMFECFDCDPRINDLAQTVESLNVYTCNDGDVVPPDVEAAKAHYKQSAEFSTFGTIWASFRVACAYVSRLRNVFSYYLLAMFQWVVTGASEGIFQRYRFIIASAGGT